MKNLFIVAAFSILSFSCKKTKTVTCPEPDLDCTAVNCFIHNYLFDFRVVDKTTGADLVFGTNARYSTSDIKLFTDAGHSVQLAITADNSQHLFHTLKASTEMYLVVAGSSNYKLVAEFKKVDCCTDRIKNLTADGQTVCTCCGDAIEIKIN